MLDILGSLKNLVNINKVCIDDNVFRLHYRLTVVILVACSVLVTSRQYIGDPIDCISDESVKTIMDTFCWIHSTYTIAVTVDRKIAYKGVEEDDLFIPQAHPGVGPSLGKHDKFEYHTYYQWVWCVLFLQGVFFYLPHWVWKTFEGGRIKMLVSDLLNAHVISNDKKAEKKRIILEYLAPNKGRHTGYGLQFFLCEVLNFLNVIIQIFITDSFLGHEFTQYGWKVLKFTSSKPYQRSDPMARVFPTMTACEINRFGPSGKIVNHDALCVLPINILNEKIYVFLWFWFIIVAALTGLKLVFRIIVFIVPKLRTYELKRQARSVDVETLKIISDNYGYGDWFLLRQLGRNMSAITFGELLNDLAGNLQSSKKNLIEYA